MKLYRGSFSFVLYGNKKALEPYINLTRPILDREEIIDKLELQIETYTPIGYVKLVNKEVLWVSLIRRYENEN